MKALLVPLDNRPVTFILPQQVARVAGLDVFSPPREQLGTLQRGCDSDSLFEWIAKTIQAEQPDVLLVCLDTLLYGGLITSRKSSEPFKTVLKKLDLIKEFKKKSKRPLTVYAQSSIMRISDNYDATEEKEYWARYGREIYEWSGYLHRLMDRAQLPAGVLRAAEAKVPADIRQDYMDTRVRNFKINQALLNLVKDRQIDRLVFSQDDSGEFGLNVMERDKLIQMTQSMNLSDRVATYAGADEVLSSLLARWLVKQSQPGKPVIRVCFSPPSVKACSSRYEGQTIGQTVEAQLKALGAPFHFQDSPEAETCDLTLIVHGSGQRQGDHIMLPGSQDLRQVDTTEGVANTLKLLETAPGQCILCDVAYANGADPALIEKLLTRKDLIQKLASYAGWNTTGNSVGSALAVGVARWFTSNRVDADHTDRLFRQALFARFADDWAYQARVRSQLNGDARPERLQELMSGTVEKIAGALGCQPGRLRLSFPWNRTFEIEVAYEEI